MTTTYSPQLAGRFVVPPGYTASLEAVSSDWEADVSGYHLTATGSGRGGVYSTLIFEGTVNAGVGLVEIVGDPTPDTVVIRDILGVPASEGTLRLFIQPIAGGSGNPCAVIDGGGATVEGVTVRKFPFAFDTPGLLTGATLYTPTIGDVLLNAWVEIDTPWNGTTPLGDLGPFTTGNAGVYLSSINGPLDMTIADGIGAGWGNSVLNGGQASSLSDVSALQVAAGLLITDAGLNPVSLAVNGTSTPSFGSREMPVRFVTADPLKFCVSQDGTNTGADPGATQGAAVLFLVTATPV